MFKPNTTIYLLSGVGLDYENTVWLDRFAYPSLGKPEGNSGISSCLFPWLKAHSLFTGYWYATFVSPDKGYIDVGRTTLVPDYETNWSENDLGFESVKRIINNPIAYIAEALYGIDYLVFSNGDEGESFGFQCAWVDRIQSINISTARIYFTIDAIVTYRQYFFFGPCWVEREHVFEDWTQTNHPNLHAIGYEAEPFAPSEDDYIFETDSNERGTALQLENLGEYDTLIVVSDIALDQNKIISNPDFPALPVFEPSPSTKLKGSGHTMDLGVGVYTVGKRDNECFKKLGKFDAMEHILYTYSVPSALINDAYKPIPDEPQFLDEINLYEPVTENSAFYTLPDTVANENSPQTGITNYDYTWYHPLNAKCFYAPFMYLSVSDKMGNSLELTAQQLKNLENYPAPVTFSLGFSGTCAPSIASGLFCFNIRTHKGSKYNPLFTMFQYASYAMTPNGSGYGNNTRDAMMQSQLAGTLIKTGIPYVFGGGALSGLSSSLTDAIKNLGGEFGGGVGAGFIEGMGGMAEGAALAGNLVGGVIKGAGNIVGGAMKAGSKAVSQIGSGYVGAGNSASIKNITNQIQARYNEQFGLPAVRGGLPTGASILSLPIVGYKFFFVHVTVELLREIDTYFSLYGYAVNKWKYPNINIRKNWCFVKTKDCSILPKYDSNDIDGWSIPAWAQAQIKERLNNGITFWNLRHAFKQDDDTDNNWNPVAYNDWGTMNPIIKCRFVKNYGDVPNSPQMVDNQSIQGEFCTGIYNVNEVYDRGPLV